MIPYGRQEITDDDVRAVETVLRSDWITQGPTVPRFEQAVAALCGARHAIAANSATSALHIACMALGVGAGDRVWTSPVTFLASANCARYCGAEVDFVDIDPRTYNLSTEALAQKLARAEAEGKGKLPKVVIPVHFAGQSCDMRAIAALAQRYGFRIIEDAAHAIGGSYLGEPVGSCRYSDIAVFSFHPVKIVTTAEGGMALTNDPALAAAMDRARCHGMVRDAALMDQPSDGPWYYQQVDLGYNYRLTDLQAALGLSQLDRLTRYVDRRHEIARRYDAALPPLGVVTPYQSPDARSALHLYPVLVPDPARRRAVFETMRAAGIGVNVHYIPVHLQPYYRQRSETPVSCPQAEAYYARTLSLPMFPALRDIDQDYVVNTLASALA